MAGEPAYTAILLGLGLDELSITSIAIPRVKKIIRNSTMRESKELLEKVMTFPTTAEVEKFVRSYMIQHFPEDFPVDGQWQKD
jgi:Phosphoenolpyruvate-protein kinase (PTS system EI component in bacteria)